MPQSVHGTAPVISTQVLSHDRSNIVIEAGGWEPMQWFLRHGPKAASGDGEGPPKKRRKVDIVDQGALIPLERAIVDIHFRENLLGRPISFDSIQADVDFQDAEEMPVNLIALKHDHVATTLSLGLTGTKGAILEIGLGPLDQTILRSLKAMSNLNASELLCPASKTICTLSLSGGRLYRIVRLNATTAWSDTKSAFGRHTPITNYDNARFPDYKLLSRHFPDVEKKSLGTIKPWQPSDFYDYVHVPSGEENIDIQVEGMTDTDLYPFQKRALSWMLSKEGYRQAPVANDVTSDGSLDLKKLPLNLWHQRQDADGEMCYVNFLQSIISKRPFDELILPSGGLLAEEMGLGKTIEIMALISSNRRKTFALEREKGTSVHLLRDEESGTEVRASKATLVITPSSILQQWRSELSLHAPQLQVFHYERPSAGKKGVREDQLLSDLCNKYDVVLTTYQTLTRELHFATDPPERNMRRARRYERKSSPLVQIQWWRICLDEAQMVESGVSAAARVACRLPRVHSWAVTGTPLRKDARDLHGLLIFLRLRPLSDNPKLWDHLIACHRHMFRRLFGQIALRHTKAQIREELQLPPQKRIVLTMPFTAVEQQQYQARVDEMCEEIGLDSNGYPTVDDWNPENTATVEAMRTWLMRLRQTCLHPQVGGRNRKALGRGKAPLRTVAEVLESMIEKVDSSIRQGERTLITDRLLRGHIVGNDGSDKNRAVNAVVLYREAMSMSKRLTAEARERLQARKSAQSQATNGQDIEKQSDTDTVSDNEAVQKTSSFKAAVRSALELLHTCSFFVATGLFQIKSNEELTQPDSSRFVELEEEETELYEIAKTVRREILRGSSNKAEALMEKMRTLEDSGSLTKLPDVQDLDGLGGIENQRILEKSDELFGVIREQSQIIVEWRAKMAELLLKPLVDEESNETTGEEYETSTKEQDTLYVYFDAMKAVTADLNMFISGESAPLIDHEARELMRSAKRALDPEKDEFVGECHDPETTISLFTIRQTFRAKKDKVGSIRGIIQEARQLEGSLDTGVNQGRASAELAIVQKHIQALNKVFKEYNKALQGLEKEIDLYRSAQNHRLQFYKELQEISDAVAPYKEELDERLDSNALDAAISKEKKTETSLNGLRKRYIYLLNLRQEETSNTNREPQRCIICTDTFENGVLISCGHQYCKDCIHLWWKSHRTCPMCKERLTLADFTDITYKPKEVKVQEEVSAISSTPSQQTHAPGSSSLEKTAIYNNVDTKSLNEINNIELSSSYGTKIDTLSRHLQWIREHDPGAKSIVFSQFREFHDVLGSAFKTFKIGYSRLGRPGAVEKFRTDPSIDCLLLDAKTDSSGLTLVNATHVFICEPLIQTAVELQAIARVHRIGQTRPTTVWMYLINDTVEESIYQISVARRMEHVRHRQTSKTKTSMPHPGMQESAIEAANSEELQGAPISKLLSTGKSGGEQVGESDLWQCLFSKAKTPMHKAVSEDSRREVDRELRAEAAENRFGGMAN